MGCNGTRVGAKYRDNFEAAVSQYSHALYRTALRHLGNHEDAEDTVQDALLSAFVHLSQFEGRSNISTWLHRIVINSARMQLRRRHRRTLLSLDQSGTDGNPDPRLQLIDSALTPLQACEKAERGATVGQLLGHLSPKLRRAFTLRHIDGLTTDESAQILGVTAGTLKSRTHRARARLGILLAVRHSPDGLLYGSETRAGITPTRAHGH